jgi:hypothetical protein
LELILLQLCFFRKKFIFLVFQAGWPCRREILPVREKTDIWGRFDTHSYGVLGQMKIYLKEQSEDLCLALQNTSDALIAGSKLELGIALTSKKFAAAESHIDGTSLLLRKMEVDFSSFFFFAFLLLLTSFFQATVKQLDDEVCAFVESVTLLEDVAEQLNEVQKEVLILTEKMS